MRMGDLAAHVRNQLIRGVLVVLPLLITVWLLKFLFGIVSGNVTPAVIAVLRANGVDGFERLPLSLAIPLFGLALTLLLVYLVGLVAGNLLGRRALAVVESTILRIPLVKSVYGAARQLLDAFAAGGSGAFSRVVLVEYPRKGVWTLAFVTKELAGPPLPGAAPSARRSLMLFLPTTPNPTSGWLVTLPADDVLDLDLSVEDGIKLVVSGGIVTPSDFAARIQAPAPPAEP